MQTYTPGLELLFMLFMLEVLLGKKHLVESLMINSMVLGLGFRKEARASVLALGSFLQQLLANNLINLTLASIFSFLKKYFSS